MIRSDLRTKAYLSVPALTLILFNSPSHAQWDIRGNASIQSQFFPEEPVHTATHDSNVSLALEAEFFRPLGENGTLTITPFLRADQRDEERTHADLREFIYTWLADSWEARIGLGKVFWGVAESVNPVDVINQTDSIENDDASAKLGQPMINLLLLRDWGTVDFYILPGFRERTFAGPDGRPRPAPLIDTDGAIFEDSAEEQHIDLAVRVSGTLDVWDWGVHVFEGTSRTPALRFNPQNQSLTPFYFQQTQVGLDIQATLESWLLKAEIVGRRGDEFNNHTAGVSGFEYTFYDIQESGADLGIVGEWLFDDRHANAPQPFQNDALLGLRLALNDEQSLEALLGIIKDLDGGGNIMSLEASRRFGSQFKGSMQLNVYDDANNDPAIAPLNKEDNVQLEIAWFF